MQLKQCLEKKKKKALNAYVRQEEKSQIKNFNFHHKKLETEVQVGFKVSRIKEIIKIRTECNDMCVHTHRNVMKPKVCSLQRSTEFIKLKLDCL